MPTSTSFVRSIQKPFVANKRLFGLLTVALIVIGLLMAGYYSYTQRNEQYFRESKLQSLDAHFDIISKQLNNDVQSYNAQNNITPQSGDSVLHKQVTPLKKEIYSSWKKSTKSIKLDQAFDELIVVINDPAKSVSEIYKSSLKGAIKPPDSLFRSSLLNIGVAYAIPEENTKYQLFGREYDYETSLNSSLKLRIKILGLVKADRYNESIRKIDSWIIALLTTFLLLAIFGLPYFKMLFIAEDERLSSNDVILSGISVVVGAPIIMMVFLALMAHYYDYYHTVPQQLNELGNDIKYRFEQENEANVNELYSLSLEKADTLNMNVGQQYFEISEADLEAIDNFKFISKIDQTNGKVRYHIALIDKDNIKNTKTLDSRRYFKDFDKSVNLWKSDVVPEYVMRPVVSIEDQTAEAIYILNNKTDVLPGYRVGSSQLRAIHDPILPFGYQFAIIDNSGEVWFHSEEGRATLENFFKVSRQLDDLKAAVLGRINAHGLVNYRDEGKLFNVAPIAGTNLSVVALYDIGLLRTRVSEVLTLASMAILLAFLLMLLITVLSLIIRNPKLGLYRYDKFLFEFITPRKENKETYILLSALFLGILLIAIIVGTFCPVAPPKVYIISLLLAMWTYLIVYYTLHPYRNRRDIKFRVRDFLLLSVIVFLNVIMIKINPENYLFHITAILLQLCCIAIIVRGQFFALPARVKNICKYNFLKIHIAYRYWYSIFLFSWLLLAAVYPAYLIFEKAQDLNDMVWFKANQIYMAKTYEETEKKLRKKLPAFQELEARYSKLYQKHLEGGLYPKAIKFKDTNDNIALDTKANDTILREFLWNMRPIYDEKVSPFKALVYQNSVDASWSSVEDLDHLSLTVSSLEKEVSFQITGHTGNKFMNTGYGFPTLKVTGILLILAILFSLILFFVDRFFAFRFRHLRPNDFDTNKEKGYIKKFGQILLDERSNSGLLLIGLPFSGKRVFAKEILKTAGYTKDATLSMLRLDNVDTNTDISDILAVLAGFDLKNGDEFNLEAHEAFIIEHLEHNIKSYDANHIKLNVISFLISKRKRVILVSEVYPSQIFAFYENPPEDHNLPLGSYEDDFNSWRNILSAFPQVLIGITSNKKKVYRILGITPTDKPTKFERTIAPLIAELGHSKFLPTLAPIILSKTLYTTENPDEPGQQLDRQRMVMHTQNLGHGYYNDIWNALPTRERYLLYDLAKDGFLNIKNRNSLFSLMKKGLIVWRDRPAIFNFSFKNFIITSVSLNEALRLEKKNRGKGSWGSTRILFYLIILTTIAFIAMGKPELLKDFETLVGTLGGLGVVIPLISKLLASGGNK